jgi:hypothetical protein
MEEFVKIGRVFALIFILVTSCWGTVISLTSPSNNGYWQTSILPDPVNHPMDFLDDEQTGQPESDIVGNAANPGILLYFDRGTAGSNTDGTVYIRVRLGSDKPTLGDKEFNALFFTGVDKNGDGALDFFVGVKNNTGNAKSNGIGLWLSESSTPGDNVSPSTTTISGTPSWFCGFDNAACQDRFNFSLVTAVDNPVNNSNVDADDSIDFFLSFSLPLDQIANFTNITDQASLSFVFGTSTQDNAFNQDLAGIKGLPQGGCKQNPAFCPDTPWTVLGVTTSPKKLDDFGGPSGAAPEPSTLLLVGLGVVAVATTRKHWRNLNE